MVKTFRQMSKKVLATVLAVVMIASCLSVSFSVLAEEGAAEPFVVPAESPAIPLQVGTKIALSDLQIADLGKGNELTWTPDENNISAVVVQDNYLVCPETTAPGIYGFTAGSQTAGSQKVWVIVAPNGTTDKTAYKLIDIDFDRDGDFVASDWVTTIANNSAVQRSNKFGYTAITPSLVSEKTVMGQNGTDEKMRNALVIAPPDSVYTAGNYSITTIAYFYTGKNDIMKDFGDYTISAQLASKKAENYYKAPGSEAVGVFARTSLGDTASNTNVLGTNRSLLLRMRNYGGIKFSSAANNSNTEVSSLTTTPEYTFYTNGNSVNELDLDFTFRGPTNIPAKTFVSNDNDASKLNVRTVEIGLSGIDTKYTIDSNVIFDSAATDAGTAYMHVAKSDFGTAAYTTGTVTNVTKWEYTNYSNNYSNNLKITNTEPKTGNIGFTSDPGALTHVFAFTVTPENILTQNLPNMVAIDEPGPGPNPPGPTPGPTSADDYVELPDGKFPIIPDSPAVPLFVDQSVTVDQLAVKIGGIWVNGADLEWEKVSGPAARYNETGAKLEGRSKGNTLFTVSDGNGHTQNVWVIVNNKDDEDFSIVNYDFSNGASIKEWISTKASYKLPQEELYTNGGYTANMDVQSVVLNSGIVVNDNGNQTTKKGLVIKPIYSKNGTEAVFLTRKELNDFADYTVEAKMAMAASLSATPDKTEGVIDSVGIFARTILSDEMYSGNLTGSTPALSATERALHVRFRNYGGVMMSAYAYGQTSADDTAMGADPNATFFTAAADANAQEVQEIAEDLWKGGDPNKAWIEAKYNANKTAEGENAIKLRRVNLTLDGNGVAYSVDGNTIYDTITEGNKLYSLTVGDDIKKDGVYNADSYDGISVPTATVFTDFGNYADAVDVQKGTIGFSTGYGTDAVIFSVKVTPKNIKDYPSSTLQYTNESYPVEYKVSSNAPIIPMWKGYRLVLENLFIEMTKTDGDGHVTMSELADKDGFVRADNQGLTWTYINSKESNSAVAEKVTVDVGGTDKQRINAKQVGRVGFNVSDNNGFSQNVWIVVSEKVEGTDFDYTLENFDFTDTNDANVFNAKDWICGSVDDIDNTIGYRGFAQGDEIKANPGNFHHGYQNGGFTYIDQDGVLGYADVVVDGKPVRALKLASEQGANAGKVTRIAVLKSDTLKDFKDYKITAEVANVMTTETDNTVSAVGFMARTVLNPDVTTAADSLVLHPTQKSTMFRMRNYGGLGVFAYRGDNYIACEENAGADFHERMWLTKDYEGTTYWTFADLDGAKPCLSADAAVDGWTMVPDEKGSENSGVTVKNLSIDLNEYDINYVLNGHEIMNTSNTDKIYRGGYYNYNQVSSDQTYAEVGSFNYYDSSEKNGTLDVVSYKNIMTQSNIGNIKYNNGTVGFSVNYGEDLYVLKYKVEALNTNEQDVPIEEMPEEHADIDATLLINQRVKLDDIDAGLTLPDVKTDAYEIKGGTILVFNHTVNDEPVVLQSKEDGYDYNITITIKDPEYQAEESENVILSTDIFADNKMRIAPLTAEGNSANDYKVTVNIYDDENPGEPKHKQEIIPGTLKLLYNSKAQGEDIISGNNDGESYNFTVVDPLSFVVKADYTSYDHNMTNIKVLGSTIRVPAAEDYRKGEAIRFLTRIPALKADPGEYDTAYIWWPDYEATQYDKDDGFVAFGSFALPTALLDASGETKFNPPATFNPQSDPEFTMGGYRVRNIPITHIAQATEKYSDAWSCLELGEYDNEFDIDVLDIPISIVSYIYYKDSAGNFGYILSNSDSNSYYNIYDKSHPITNAKQALTESVITPYRYENFNAVPNTTTFAVDIKGAYALDWHIETAEGEVIDAEGYAGTTDYAVGRFAVTLPSIPGMKFCAAVKGQNVLNRTAIDGTGVVFYREGKQALFEIDANGTYSEPNGDKPVEPTEPEEPIVSESGSLANLKYKLASGANLKAMYVGSSIEYGADAWPAKVTEWLNSQTTGTVTGVTSTFDTSAAWHAARYQNDVLSENPDIIFIESGLHDTIAGDNSGNAYAPKAKGSAILLESMIRQTWAANSQTEIVVVGVTGRDYLNGSENFDAYEAVADYEDVTYISLIDFARQAYESGQWGTYFGGSSAINPNADGHAKYANLITAAIRSKLDDIEETPAAAVNYEAKADTYYDYQVPTSFEFAYKGSEAIKTTGTWNTYTPESSDGVKMFIKDHHTPNEAFEGTQGATMTYYFTGNSVMLYGRFFAGSNVTVTLDDDPTTQKTIGGDKTGGCIYLYDSLPEKVTHHVTLTVTGDQPARIAAFASGKTANDEPTVTKDYNPIESPYADYTAGTGTSVPDIFGTVENKPQIGTGHDLDNDASTNSFSYAVGDEINFIVRAKVGTVINYELKKDNPNVNTDTALGETKPASGNVVKTGTATGDLLVTTTMKEAGTARLHVTVADKGIDITAAAGMADIEQPLDYMGTTPASKISEMKSAFSTQANTIQSFIADFYESTHAQNNGNALKTYLNGAAVSGDYRPFAMNGSTKIKMSCSKVEGGFRYIDFIIETGSEGITTTNSSGKFPNQNYNERPATGCLIIPTTATDITKLKFEYQGYGAAAGAHSGGEANTLYIRMNSHGYDNKEFVAKDAAIADDPAYGKTQEERNANKWTNVLNNTSFANGGVNGFMMAAESATDYTKSYAYGILKRDYVALKAGEAIFKLITGNDASDASDIKVTGRSMGGWQAIMMSALDNAITTTDVYYPWMCSAGDQSSKYIQSTFNAANVSGILPFSSVIAAKYIATTMNNRPASYTFNITGGFSDLTSPASGVIALYNALASANCNKSITLRQFEGHGNSGYQVPAVMQWYTSTASGTYDSTHPHDYSEEEPTEPQDEPTGELKAKNLNNTYYKALTKGELTVAYIGGSVTVGQNASASNSTSWRALTRDWLKTNVVSGQIITINEVSKGVGGSSSVWGAARFKADILDTYPDLIFIDCSINDRYIGHNAAATGKPGEAESAALLDAMIRMAQKQRPNADIIVITVPNAETVANYKNDQEAENAAGHRKVADYEGVTYINLTPIAVEMLDEANGSATYYGGDEVHPVDKGYAKYAEFIEDVLATKFEESAAYGPTDFVNHTVQPNPYRYGESDYVVVPDKYHIDSVGSSAITFSADDWVDIKYTDIKPRISNTAEFAKFSSPQYMGKAAKNKNAKITYTFTGISLHLFGYFNAGANVSIKVDGSNVATIAQSGAAGEIYVCDGLANTTHTVEITVGGTMGAGNQTYGKEVCKYGNGSGDPVPEYPAYFCSFAVGQLDD